MNLLETAAKVSVVLIFPLIVWGDPGACPNGFSGSPASQTLATLGSTGCSNVDKNFTNFGVSGASATGIFTAPTTSNLYFFSPDASFTASSITSASSDIGDVDQTLEGSSTFGGTGTWYLGENSNSAGTSSATITNVVQVNSATAGNPALSFYIDGVTFDPEGSIGWEDGVNAGGVGAILSIVITETFCIGHTTTASCPAADKGIIVATENATGMDDNTGVNNFSFQCSTGASGVITCASSTSDTATFLPTTTVAVSEQVVLTQDSGLEGSLDLLDVQTSWQEGADTPEPGALLLCGAGLLGLAAVYRRRLRLKRLH